jgi:hypothetical protein
VTSTVTPRGPDARTPERPYELCPVAVGHGVEWSCAISTDTGATTVQGPRTRISFDVPVPRRLFRPVFGTLDPRERGDAIPSGGRVPSDPPRTRITDPGPSGRGSREVAVFSTQKTALWTAASSALLTTRRRSPHRSRSTLGWPVPSVPAPAQEADQAAERHVRRPRGTA